MQTAYAEKLNKAPTTYDRLPTDFFGKKENSPFAGLSCNQRAILGRIYTLNTIFGGLAKITYDDLVAAFHMSRSTVHKNIKILIDRGIIEKSDRSRYRILPKFDTRDFLIIQHFLYTETWNIDGKFKRLPRQSVFMCALVERHQNNPKAKGVPFVSSKQRFATALGIPPSTAFDGLKAVIKADVLHRNLADENGTLSEGKGVNNSLLSAFSVDRRIRNVKCRKVKSRKGSVDDEPTQASSAAFDRIAAEMIAENKAKEIDDRLQFYSSYREIKTAIKKLKAEQITAIRKQDKPLTEELTEKYTHLLKRFRRYLKERDVSPDLANVLIRL